MYARPDNIADAADTVVTITVDDRTYEHRAYALGLGGGPDGGETDEDRVRLFAFIVAATDLVTDPVANEVGAEEPYRSASYLIRPQEVETPEPTGDALIGIEQMLVDWPSDAPVRLAAAGECAEVPTDRFARVLRTRTSSPGSSTSAWRIRWRSRHESRAGPARPDASTSGLQPYVCSCNVVTCR
jgi:hypothetical protein